MIYSGNRLGRLVSRYASISGFVRLSLQETQGVERRRLNRNRAAFVICVALAAALIHMPRADAQELEPRAYSVSPVGVNIVALGYGRSVGDLSFDPTLPIEDAEATINASSVGYFRAINLLGRSANVAVAVPYLWGNAQGRLGGEFQSPTRSGLADTRLRFAVNLVGAPAMNLKQFAAYRQKTNLGFSLAVVAPTGQYDPNKLINVGSNRWAFRPELGLSRAVGNWTFDVYGGAWLFTTNENFQGRTKSQKPIGTAQFHMSYDLAPRLWVAFNANFFTGGKTRVDGTERMDFQRNSRLGTTVSIPVDRRQSVKIAFSTGAYTTIGGDFNSVAIAYQYLWGAGL